MRRALLLLLLPIIACGPGSAMQEVDTRLLVFGDDMGPVVENVLLTRGSSAVSSALVTVNGTVLTETLAGHYSGQLPAYLLEGSPIQVTVISGSDTIVGTTTVPRAPSLVSPIGGTVISPPAPIDFTWNSSSDPDGFRIGILYTDGDQFAVYGPTARSGLVITSRLPRTAAPYTAYLAAYNDGTFTGPANPNSKMRVRQPGGVVNLVLEP